MKLIKAALVVGCACVGGTTSLMAQEFTGAEVFIGGLIEDGTGFSEVTDIYGASVELSFGRFGIQGDVSNRNFEIGDNIPSWGLHGIYAATDELKLGLHYGEETWSGQRYSNIGAELAWDRGPWGLEAWVTRDSGIDVDWLSVVSAAKATYSFNEAFSLHGKIAFSGGDNNTRYYGVGGSWQHDSGLFVRLDAGHFDYSRRNKSVDVYALRVGYEFGNGVSFNHRNSNESLSGYGN
ncbi:hypothetical protein [Halocynthiibacter sp.]|uniref:hypothetical protein n=1 Tax=Halocynthiibacter sp. TaxID=1979210 RepID=UPI003C3A1358